MSCFAGGVNLPQIALKKLLGEDADWQIRRETKIVAEILQPVVIA